MRKIVTLLIVLVLSTLEIWADQTVGLYVGEKKLLDATYHMNISNAIYNVYWDIDADKLHYRQDGWTVIVAPVRYFDGEATVKCSWIEKDQTKPIPYPTYNRSYTWKIRCEDNPIVLYTTELRLQPGEYGDIRVDCTNNNVSYYSNCSYTYQFSTKNSSVAKVNQGGHVEAVEPGQTEIVISSPNARNDKYCMVIVESAPTSKLTLTASPSGGEVSVGTTVYLTAKTDGSTVSGCNIYYTLNGSTPTKSSTKYTSSGITINSNCTVKAIAYKNGYEDSEVLTATYTVPTPKKLTLSASPSGGQVSKGTIVTLTAKADGSTVSGCDIYYTLNGNTPTKNSTKYSSGITINSDCTLKAIAYKSGYEDSNVLTETYTIKTTNGIDINATNFPDANFRNYLLSQSYGEDEVLTDAEVKGIRNLVINRKDIRSLKGIEFLTALATLKCDSNKLNTLDVSKNTVLTELSCDQNQLTSLDVSKNTALTTLHCNRNQLTSLDVSKNTVLITLKCGQNQLTSLDVSKNKALTTLYCTYNQLTTLDVSKNIALITLYCYYNQFATLDVSNNTSLTTLWCGKNLTSLDVSKNTALTALYCQYAKLTTLDVSKNTALTTLSCYDNQLTTLDVSKNTALTTLSCYGNQLTTLDVSKNKALTKLVCHSNQIKGNAMTALINSLPSIDTNQATQFYVIKNNGEGNVCNKSQVAAAKAKGWTPQYYNGSEWLEYEGSDDVLPESITISSTMTVTAGQTITLTPTITPDDAVTTLTWSSDDESIATVSSEGVVTGVTAGQTFINVTTDNGKTAYCKLTVKEPEVKVASIILDVSTMDLVEGKSQTLGATVKPDNATDKTVKWSSDDASVATVDNTGKVTAVAAGEATITCTANDESGVSATCKVTVKAAVKGIELPKTMTVAAGQTLTLTPTITPADAVTALTWTSDDETIATVNSDGVVTGVKKGQTFINVETDNGKSAYCKLTVTAPDPISITLPKSATLHAGETVTLTATITPEDAETTLTWKSDDESVVLVSADGVLTGVTEGLALVTATTSNGLTSNACKVKVEAPDGITDVQSGDKAGTVYTISGQRLVAPKKGLNIVGGRKVVVK